MYNNLSLENILKDKNIKFLVHFTRVENLEGIISNGLLPRSVLDEYNMKYSYNDVYRRDGCKNAICTSIGFPNYRMFYNLRYHNPDVDWAVILIDARILCAMKCAFCKSNAAQSDISSNSIQSRMGINAFLSLFEDLPYPRTRSNMNLPTNYPTNPQAEVLVFDRIPTSCFIGVIFDKKQCYYKYKNLLDNAKIMAYMNNPKNNFFSCRKDYSFWQKGD